MTTEEARSERPEGPLAHYMDDYLLDVCGTAAPAGWALRVTPVKQDVTCPACRETPEWRN